MVILRVTQPGKYMVRGVDGRCVFMHAAFNCLTSWYDCIFVVVYCLLNVQAFKAPKRASENYFHFGHISVL